MFEYNNGDIQFQINEFKEVCYVSLWSEFMLSQMPYKLDNMIVCDYGAGTGVLSVAAALKNAASVISIEKVSEFRNLMKSNFNKNSVNHRISIFESSHYVSKKKNFQYVFCNPACYPSIIGDLDFYHGGKTGMDMIDEVVLFASEGLSETGHLLMLISSVLPISILYENLKKVKLNANIINSTLVPLRTHLSDVIKQYVDYNSKDYPEMHYVEKKDILFEEVYLYDIQF